MSGRPMVEREIQTPYLPENLWGYGKRLRFVDDTLQREFPGRRRNELKLLDVGCGNGSQLAIPLAKAGYQVTAVDPHRPSIERGRGLAPTVRFLHGTLSDFSLTRFDCVILSEVLEHLSAPDVLLSMALTCLSESGILIVTVPNGYGEFELDRWMYRALQVDKLVVYLWPMFKKHQPIEALAGSDDENPHIQRFTVSKLLRLFVSNDLQLIEARGTSLASGPFVSHLLGRFNIFIHWNAAIADYLPLSLVAGWMFSLKLNRC